MADTLGKTLAAEAKKNRDAKHAAHADNVQKILATLRPRVNAAAKDGSSYLQLLASNEADFKIIQAIATPQGLKFMKEQEIEVETAGTLMNLWWEPRDTIEREREELMNPKNPVTPPTTEPVTPPVTETVTPPATETPKPETPKPPVTPGPKPAPSTERKK